MMLNETRVKILLQKIFNKNYRWILLVETKILQIHAEKK